MHARPMTAVGDEDEGDESAVRRATGGDVDAIAWIVEHAGRTDEAVVAAMAELLEDDPATWPSQLDHAASIAVTSRDRQIVAIARARLQGDLEQVDALARDHLVDHPDSLIVAWIAGLC